VIPRVHDAAADMFPLWSCLLDACRLADIDGEVCLLPGEILVRNTNQSGSHGGDGVGAHPTHFPISTLREDPYSDILPGAAAFAGIQEVVALRIWTMKEERVERGRECDGKELRGQVGGCMMAGRGHWGGELSTRALPATTLGAPCCLADDEGIRSSPSPLRHCASSAKTPAAASDSPGFQRILAAACAIASTELSLRAIEGELELVE
jgi:hypothetical protein